MVHGAKDGRVRFFLHICFHIKQYYAALLIYPFTDHLGSLGCPTSRLDPPDDRCRLIDMRHRVGSRHDRHCGSGLGSRGGGGATSSSGSGFLIISNKPKPTVVETRTDLVQEVVDLVDTSLESGGGLRNNTGVGVGFRLLVQGVCDLGEYVLAVSPIPLPGWLLQGASR